jgi:hypothetical protein
MAAIWVGDGPVLVAGTVFGSTIPSLALSNVIA